MNEWRSTVYRIQWIVPILIGVWWFLAPGAGIGGWATLMMLFVAPVLVVLLIVPAIVSVASRHNRSEGMVPKPYAIAAPVPWILLLVPPAALEGADDVRSYPSILENIGLPAAAAGPVAYSFLLGSFVAWIVCLSTASGSHEPPQPHRGMIVAPEAALEPGATAHQMNCADAPDHVSSGVSLGAVDLHRAKESAPATIQTGPSALATEPGCDNTAIFLALAGFIGYVIPLPLGVGTSGAVLALLLRLVVAVSFAIAAIVVGFKNLRRTRSGAPGRGLSIGALTIGLVTLVSALTGGVIQLMSAISSLP